VKEVSQDLLRREIYPPWYAHHPASPYCICPYIRLLARTYPVYTAGPPHCGAQQAGC